MDKAALLSAYLDQLQAELEVLTRAALMARDEATNEESKAENKYDTRGQEAAYLAESQAKLAAELQTTIQTYRVFPTRTFARHEAVDAGAVVELAHGKTSSFYFLGPRHGGLEATIDGKVITLITPSSPLGRQLMGRTLGAAVTLPGRAKATQATLQHLF